MKNVDWVTMFKKFNFYTVVVKPHTMNFSCTLQLPTFTGELLVLCDKLSLTNSFQSEIK